MNEPVCHFFKDGTQLQLRQLTMSEAIEMESQIWQLERQQIINMLDDAQATPEQRLDALKKHYEKRGLASEMTRQMFRANHAKSLLMKVAPEGDAVLIEKLAPNDVCELALRCIGYELNDSGTTSGKAQTQQTKP